MSDLLQGRSAQLDRVLSDLLRQAPEVEAASVVSFDGLPMASALPVAMDENRVAAMSAALLSLGERAAEGLGRGELSQVYVEGESGTVFLISAEDEAVLVAVGAKGAKVGLLLYEIRRAAQAVAAALRQDEPDEVPTSDLWSAPELRSQPAEPSDHFDDEPIDEPMLDAEAETAGVDEPVVDQDDPLGLADRINHDQVRSTDEASEDESVYATANAQPTPDLGAWATFTPGAGANASSSSSSSAKEPSNWS